MLKRTSRRASNQRMSGLLGTILLCLAAHGVAGAPVAPATSSGSYTVTYARCSSCYADWLEERVGETGAWRAVGSGSTSFSNKPAGRYDYRIGYLYIAYEFSPYTDYSATSSVLVAGAVPPVNLLEAQLSYRYEVRRGDINADGRNDLYVGRTAGGVPGDGTVDRILLRQGLGGRFTASAATSAESLTARNWPGAGVRIFLKDVNADGFADLLLHGVAGAVGVAGVPNQIVYAPAQVLSFTPKGVRPVDATFKKFAVDSGNYLRTPNYFSIAAPLRPFVQVQVQTVCEYMPGGGLDTPIYGLDIYCYSIPHAVVGVYADYSVFDPSALAIWSYESAIGRNAMTAKAGLDKINGLLDGIAGVRVGGWGTREPLDTQRPISDAQILRGIDFFTALLRMGEASAATPEESGVAGRSADAVYITGRRVVGFLPMHTALEYRGSTVSAYDSDDRLLHDGTLVSQVNWVRDRPLLTMTLGTVSSSLAPALYWARLLSTDRRYRDNLPYDTLPSIGRAGYNSNGFSHGIVQATGGNPSTPMNRFVGGEKPVPASAFN